MRGRRMVVTIGVGYLAVIDLFVGAWAVVGPRSFFLHFPGFGRAWVAANPPYNHHLVVDAGAGFLGVGVALALALLWRERRVILVAVTASLVHDVPHVLYHLGHPARTLSRMDRAASTGGLAFGCFVALVLLALEAGVIPAPD